jgi:hypothetical protein
MAQRHSNYARKADEAYWTPRWVYDALYSVETFKAPWDCAPRNADFDFLEMKIPPSRHIVTNPPYGAGGKLAERFVRHALSAARGGYKVAMLLPMGFDAAKGRIDIFRDCPTFHCKIVLLTRIRWENLAQKKAGPSQNHAWYVWDERHTGPATMHWLRPGSLTHCYTGAATTTRGTQGVFENL